MIPNEHLEEGFHKLARILSEDDYCAAGLLLHASEAMSAKRSANALERIAETLDDILGALNHLATEKVNG